MLAHVPDINDFVAGKKVLLAPGGIITMEFPQLMRLAEENQFDTIYPEQFSYLSLSTVKRTFAHHGLILFDVEELSAHGGSIRIFARHSERDDPAAESREEDLKLREATVGMQELPYYAEFAGRVQKAKATLLEFIVGQHRCRTTVVGFGAPGKGNTLLKHCGIILDFPEYTVDRPPHKQGNFLPASGIPILSPNKIFETWHDYILVLPANLRVKTMEQMSEIRSRRGMYEIPIPEVQIYD